MFQCTLGMPVYAGILSSCSLTATRVCTLVLSLLLLLLLLLFVSFRFFAETILQPVVQGWSLIIQYLIYLINQI